MMKKNRQDGNLIKAYLGGDKMAFQKLYNNYERQLFSYILRYTRNKTAADDVFQQTWIKVINGLKKYEEKGIFSSWLFGIAHNSCIDHIRKNSREKINDNKSIEIDKMESRQNMCPEKEFLKKEKTQYLKKAIEQLKPDQKDVILLRLYTDLTFKEIAEQLGYSLNTVLGRMHYALINLRKIINGGQKNVAV